MRRCIIDWVDFRLSAENRADIDRVCPEYYPRVTVPRWVHFPIVGHVLCQLRPAPARRRDFSATGAYRQAAYWSPSMPDAFLSVNGQYLAHLLQPGELGWNWLQNTKDDLREGETLELQRLDIAWASSHITSIRTKGHVKITQYEVRGMFTGWTIGTKDKLIRIYRKDVHDPGASCEIRFADLATRYPWRIEIQLRRDALLAYGVTPQTWTETKAWTVAMAILESWEIEIEADEWKPEKPENEEPVVLDTGKRPVFRNVEKLIKQGRGCFINAALASWGISIPDGMPEQERETWAEECCPGLIESIKIVKVMVEETGSFGLMVKKEALGYI